MNIKEEISAKETVMSSHDPPDDVLALEFLEVIGRQRAL
jgi:hypothetical protein